MSAERWRHQDHVHIAKFNQASSIGSCGDMLRAAAAASLFDGKYCESKLYATAGGSKQRRRCAGSSLENSESSNVGVVGSIAVRVRLVRGNSLLLAWSEGTWPGLARGDRTLSLKPLILERVSFSLSGTRGFG
jgi:hypothetical protein